MARRAGVTRDETRHALLASAAAIFAERGYDGATVAEIAAHAGLSTGAIYGQFANKAELFAAAVEAQIAHALDRWLDLGREGGVALMLQERGEALNRPSERDGRLLVQAILAGSTSPEVVELLRSALAVREAELRSLVAAAQASGEITDALPPAAVVRLLVMLGFGATLVASLGAQPVPADEWSALMSWLAGAAQPVLPPNAPSGDRP